VIQIQSVGSQIDQSQGARVWLIRLGQNPAAFFESPIGTRNAILSQDIPTAVLWGITKK
jgi:hypothetical protein